MYISLFTENVERVIYAILREPCMIYTYEMRCAICYHLYNSKNVENAQGEVLLLLKFRLKACSFTKSNTPPCMFFTFFKLCKWYKIAQNITYDE